MSTAVKQVSGGGAQYSWNLADLADPPAFIEMLPIAVYACDAAGRVLWFNNQAVEMWGRTPRIGDDTELFCGSYKLYVDGNPIARAETPMAWALRTGSPVEGKEGLVERPDGSRVWAMVHIVPVRDETGRVIGAVNCFHDVTDRHRVEEDLRRHEQDLADFFDNGAVALHLVDANGIILRANKAELDLLGYSAEEYIGRPIAQFHADQDTICDILACLTRGEHLQKYPARLRTKDGSIKHVEITSSVHFRDGNFANTRCFTVDVTAEKIARDKSAEQQKQLHQLLESLPAAVYTTDAEGRITYFNEAAVVMSGRRPELGVDKWCVTWRLYSPDGRLLPHDECPMAIALREGRAVRGVQAIAERPDGTRVPFMPFPTPLFDASGRVSGGINMLVDISERERAEESGRRLAAIVETSDDAILSLDTRSIIRSWNKGAERLFGYMAQEAIGQPIYIVIPSDRHDEEPAMLERIARGEHIQHYETVRTRKDGSSVDISLTVSPLTDAGGKFIGTSKIARDITARKQEDQRRQLLIGELNHRVKNTLATVQSIAAQTFRGQGIEQSKRFERRLIALAAAHDVLTRGYWESADLNEIATAVVSPCVSPVSRFAISGPAVRLTPKMAVSLAMVLHELCTNALKYGALSDQSGLVRLSWNETGVDDGRKLHLRWEESGGPEVVAPTRKGFGTRMIEQVLAREVGAPVSLSFRTSGVICEMEIPLS